MSEADKRVLDLLDRWYASLELHTRYLKLSDADYARVQAWPKHQRPNKWIVDLAKQRVSELKQHVLERKELGDDEFADALELMGFLTSLLATEHLERFVPLALPSEGSAAKAETPKVESDASSTVRARTVSPARTATAAAPSRPASARPVAARATTPVPRRGAQTAAQKAPAVQKPSAARSPAARTTATAARPVPRPAPRLSEQVTKLIIADAVRLLDWGNEWPQLAGLIARLADRPAEKEVWNVLTTHRTTIESRAKLRRD
jgi:hypothetical protein